MGTGVLAIDQGTSGTKAIVVDDRGAVVSAVEIPVALRTLVDGGVEQDPDELLASVRDAGRRAIAASPVEVVAVGVANQGETVVAWDPTSGEALSAAISWQDRRSSDLVAGWAPHAARLATITGLALDPYFTAPKLRWLADRSPVGARVTGLDAWINWHLCGRAVTDVATASRSLLLDLTTRTWSSEAADVFGIALGDLPDIVSNAGDLGRTTVFGPDLALGSLIVDQQAALYGEHCVRPGDAKCTYGTGAFYLLNCGATAAPSRHGLSASVAWDTGDDVAYCLDGQVYSAGSAVDWLVRMGLARSSADLDRVESTTREASRVTCVPAFAGLGAPHWEPRATAYFEGVTLSTTPDDVVWSVMDGVACQVAQLVAASEADVGATLEVLRVDGGLSGSRVLMQHQADVLQRPVEVFVSPHATALGVADLASRGVGRGPLPWDDSVVGHRYEPTMSAARAAEHRERFADATHRVLTAGRKS